ncbi:MAG: phosphoribosyltransferase [Bacteroidia bacterium]|nr:phosphoribosyltransferase [Bacteroidia bacterium]
MEASGTLILNHKQIEQRINRIAYQVYEDNLDEKEVILAGIMISGFRVAEMIGRVLKKIAPFSVVLMELRIDKHSHENHNVTISLEKKRLSGKSIVIIDDVLNSGRTMMYSLRPVLEADVKKLRTAVLIDRNHRQYPIAADFVGLSLATTLQEHVSVSFDNSDVSAHLN